MTKIVHMTATIYIINDLFKISWSIQAIIQVAQPNNSIMVFQMQATSFGELHFVPNCVEVLEKFLRLTFIIKKIVFYLFTFIRFSFVCSQMSADNGQIQIIQFQTDSNTSFISIGQNAANALKIRIDFIWKTGWCRKWYIFFEK